MSKDDQISQKVKQSQPPPRIEICRFCDGRGAVWIWANAVVCPQCSGLGELEIEHGQQQED